LHELKHYPQIELEFLYTGVEEIIKCRQVLKYTYCYGYYMKNMTVQQKNLFEHQQTLLEEACELLHE
jgi:ariadne-1